MTLCGVTQEDAGPANRISSTHSWQSEKQPRPEHAADYISLQTKEEEESTKQHWCDSLCESCIQPAERTTRAADSRHTLTCRQRKTKHQTELFVKSELKAVDGSGSFPRNFTTTTTKAKKTDVLTDTLYQRLPQQFVINIRNTAPASEPSTSRAAQDDASPLWFL